MNSEFVIELKPKWKNQGAWKKNASDIIADQSAKLVIQVPFDHGSIEKTGLRSMDSDDSNVVHVHSTDPLSNFLRTKPSNNALVRQGRCTMYFEADKEALYAATHTYIDHVENVEIQHWYNNSDQINTNTVSSTIGLTVTNGEEIGVGVNIGAAFKGLSIGTEVSKRTLSSRETSSSTTTTKQVSVPAHADLWFYQRKYVFRTEMTWIFDGWGRDWDVGSKGGYHIQNGVCTTEVMVEDFVTTITKLPDENSIAFTNIPYEHLHAGTTRKFEDLTDRARNKLRSIGIDGSQQN